MEGSEQTQIERLGRMRPEKFSSLWMELGFCFSIVMSQVLTVWYYVYGSHTLLTCQGILCLRLQCHSTNFGFRASDTSSITNMAVECILTRSFMFSAGLRTSG